MIVWLNGPFGGGKTTTARLVCHGEPSWRVFDPELVGFRVRSSLPDHPSGGDFQHLPPWRALVPTVAAVLAGWTSQHLVAVQTVHREQYWRELRDGLTAHALKVLHIVLDADRDTLEARIAGDTEEQAAESWRLGHIDAYLEARSWMLPAADLVLDTSTMPATEVAASVRRYVASLH